MKITKTLRQVVGVLAVGAALALTGSAARAQSSGAEEELPCSTAAADRNDCATCDYIRNVESKRANGCCTRSLYNVAPVATYGYTGVIDLNNCYKGTSVTQCVVETYTWSDQPCYSV
jgi:hypothetical protein